MLGIKIFGNKKVSHKGSNSKQEAEIFRKKSYSQSGEDIIVKYIFDLIGIKKFNYIDIGAHHPYYLSNTALFYELGCRGINIEPDSILFESFVKCRPDDVNLNIGISNNTGEQDFYVMNVPTLNTFSKEEAEKCCREGNFSITKTLKIKTEQIQNIIAQYSNNIFPQFLNIDAEGIDELIINSIDFRTNFPIVICIETISFSESGRGIKNTALIKKIKNSGYINYADTYINSIFVRRDRWIR
jgi:FkbM family methyltransferase